MIASYILRADLLDIIFENRNKAYGAYVLRKLYGQHVLKSLLGVAILLALFSLIVLNTKPPQPVYPVKYVDVAPGVIKPDVVPAEPKTQPASAKREKSLSEKFVLVDSLQKIDSLPDDVSLRVNSNSINVGEQPPFQGVAGGGTGPVAVASFSPQPVPVTPVVDLSSPVEKADIDPSYPGGMKALTKFLERNLVNPAEINEGEHVSVKVKFVVGFDGELKAFEVKEDGGEQFNNEVIRVLKKMPRWIPGKTKGQNVSVFFTIPVKFINEQ